MEVDQSASCYYHNLLKAKDQEDLNQEGISKVRDSQLLITNVAKEHNVPSAIKMLPE